MADYILVDTSVVFRLTQISPDSRAYDAFLGDRRLAVNFQIVAEVRNWPPNLSANRKLRCEELLAACLNLPNSEATGVWYGRVAQQRERLRRLHDRGGGAGDADVWVISSALEHTLPMMSHDTAQVRLARSMGISAYTNLDGLRDENPPLPSTPSIAGPTA